MTYKEAAKFAKCSVSTLKRWECAWCGQSALYQLTRGCGAIYEKCDPLKKHWPPNLEAPLTAEKQWQENWPS